MFRSPLGLFGLPAERSFPCFPTVLAPQQVPKWSGDTWVAFQCCKLYSLSFASQLSEALSQFYICFPHQLSPQIHYHAQQSHRSPTESTWNKSIVWIEDENISSFNFNISIFVNTWTMTRSSRRSGRFPTQLSIAEFSKVSRLSFGFNSSTISSLLISCSLDAAFLRVASTYTVLVSTLLTSVSDGQSTGPIDWTPDTLIW